VGKGVGAISTNTVVGLNALNGSNTGLGANCAFGNLSLSSNTSGQQNSGFGYASLRYNTTGQHLSGFGTNALQNNITGSFNTSCGSASLYFNTTGSNNSALGYQALYNNTTNVATLGSITGGTGYNGGASGGPLTVQSSLSSGSAVGSAGGSYPTLSITVVSGVITAATLVTNGVGFQDTTTVLTVTSAAMVTAGFAAVVQDSQYQ
jgi:hypothetical protein